MQIDYFIMAACVEVHYTKSGSWAHKWRRSGQLVVGGATQQQREQTPADNSYLPSSKTAVICAPCGQKLSILLSWSRGGAQWTQKSRLSPSENTGLSVVHSSQHGAGQNVALRSLPADWKFVSILSARLEVTLCG